MDGVSTILHVVGVGLLWYGKAFVFAVALVALVGGSFWAFSLKTAPGFRTAPNGVCVWSPGEPIALRERLYGLLVLEAALGVFYWLFR